jgi:uncharacterized protein YjbI with pentapeptide repeats
MVFKPTTVEQLNEQVQNALKDPPSYPEGQPDKWVLSSITDWYSANSIPFSLEDLKNIGMTPSQMKAVWSQLGTDIDGEAAFDESGRSVSLSSDGTIMAIGAYGNDASGSASGHVRVYQYNTDSTSWTKMGQDIDGEGAYDYSGWSVSLSSDGTIMAIGAYGNDGTGSNSGHVRVYEYSGGTWNQMGTDIDGEAANDNSGISVSLSSDGLSVAIGAHYNDANGSNSGHVRVYQYSGGTWTQLGGDIDGEATSDRSGTSVSLSSDGSIVAIGAIYNDGNTGNTNDNRGHVRVYQYSGGTWNKMGTDIDGEAASDRSGTSVSLSSDGSIVAIGAIYNDGNGNDSGHVRVYEYSGGTWNKMGTDIDGEAASDRSGTSVSLSSDGSIVAIGAIYNDGNGNDSGHVRVYEYSGGTWNKMGTDIDGEAAYDNSGYSVSLSGDGTIVAIGAIYNDGSGSDSGHVRVYDVSNGYSLTELKAANFTLAELKAANFTAAELKAANFTAAELKAADFTAAELKDGGFTAAELKAANFTLAELKAANFTAAELKADFTLAELKAANFTAAELKAANFTAAELKAVGFTLAELKAGGFTAAELKAANFTAAELKAADFTAAELKDGGFTAAELKAANFTLAELKAANFTAAELKADFTLAELKAANFTAAELKAANFTAAELKAVGFTLAELKAGGFTAAELKAANFTAAELKAADFTAAELKDGGFTAAELKAANFTLAELKAANFTAAELKADFTLAELKAANFTAAELKAANFTAAELKAGGFTAAELKAANFTAAELKAANFTAAELKAANFTLAELKAANFTAAELKAANFTAAELKAGGFNLSEVMNASFPFTQILEAGYSISVTQLEFFLTQLGNDIDGEAANDYSGRSVSLSSDGKIVAIGAFGNDGTGSDSGHVRVYKYDTDSSSWTQMGGDIDGEAASDISGISVSLSSDGSIVAIGADLNDGNGSSSGDVYDNRGHVRVFEWKEFTGGNYHYNNQTQNNNQPLSIIITSKDENGDYIAPTIGNSYWTQLGIDIDGEASEDFSGTSVSLSSDGTIVAIGATYNDGNGSSSGHVRVYEWKEFTGGNYHYSNQTQDSNQTKPLIITPNNVAPTNGNSYWTQMGIDIDGEDAYDNSGYSVSLSGNGTIVAIGAPYNSDNGSSSGHVRVYKYDNTTSSWKKMGGDIDGEARYDNSGYSVSLSGNGKIVAIGANYNDGTNGADSGHVRVYQYDDVAKSWTQLGTDIDGEAGNDLSGTSVSLSSDGKIVAIGAYGNDGTGNESGHVRVYQYTNGSWSQLGDDIDGEAAYDLSGISVSLSSDGSIVAIGAHYNDGNGNGSGHVRVYQLLTTQLKNLGYNASDLATVGFDALQLKTLGYNSEQLNAPIFDISQLIAAGYTLTNLIDNGILLSDLVKSFTLDELKDKFTLAELKAAFTLAELKAEFTLAELKAEFTLTDLKAAGFILDELKDKFTLAELKAAFTLAELKTEFTLAELKAEFKLTDLKTAGFTLDELKAVGFILAELKAAGFILDELKAVGFILAELKTAFTLAELKDKFTLAELKAEFKLTDLKAAGFILDELKAVGFLLAELKAAGFILDELKDKFTLAELNKEFTISELKDGDFTLAELKNGGINVAELHEVGYSFNQLRVAGFSAVDCRNANMSNSELPTSGFSIKQLREGGLSATRMRSAGYSAKQLYENGYPVSHLFEADYSASEIRLAGVDALQARFGGISNKEMKTAGYTVEEYKAASYKASRMKEAGYTRAELEGVYSKEELDAVGL